MRTLPELGRAYLATSVSVNSQYHALVISRRCRHTSTASFYASFATITAALNAPCNQGEDDAPVSPSKLCPFYKCRKLDQPQTIMHLLAPICAFPILSISSGAFASRSTPRRDAPCSHRSPPMAAMRSWISIYLACRRQISTASTLISASASTDEAR